MKRQLTLLAAGVLAAGGAHAALDNKAAEELMKKGTAVKAEEPEKKPN